tara:strand:- start:764 stop:1297 length:534 start_codon:yes stop_codon:yes gene_type:complete
MSRHLPPWTAHGSIYSVSFSDLECSGVKERDIFELQGTINTRISLISVDLSQHSEVAGASEESIPVEILTGGVGARAVGGTTGAPVRFGDNSKGATALAECVYNSTDAGLAATDETLRHGDAWHLNKKFVHSPPVYARIGSSINGRIAVRIGVPADAISINGNIVWQELGKVPGESL